MSTVQPRGEKLRQALKLISEKKQSDETIPISLIIQEAALHFNLSPKEEDFLMSFYQESIRGFIRV